LNHFTFPLAIAAASNNVSPSRYTGAEHGSAGAVYIGIPGTFVKKNHVR
jgi:hypothetical protein